MKMISRWPGKYIAQSTIGYIFLALTVSMIFIVPMIPAPEGKWIYNAVITLIFFISVFSLRRDTRRLLLIVLLLMMLHWIAVIFDLRILEIVSQGSRIIFFVAVVIMMAHQVASSKKVDVGTILEAVNSYLLIGMMFAVLVALLNSILPGSFNFHSGQSVTGEATYFTFVTMATLGYGDIIPTTPLSRSLSIFIAVTGQIYIAVVIAMLVGKFSAEQINKDMKKVE